MVGLLVTTLQWMRSESASWSGVQAPIGFIYVAGCLARRNNVSSLGNTLDFIPSSVNYLYMVRIWQNEVGLIFF
jgi:hypothetical protein